MKTSTGTFSDKLQRFARHGLALAGCAAALLLCGCGGVVLAETADAAQAQQIRLLALAPTSTALVMELAEPTASPTAPASPTPSATPTAEPTASPAPEPSATARPTAKPAAKPTATPKPTARPTATVKPTAKPAATPESTATQTPAATPEPTPVITQTPKPTETPGKDPGLDISGEYSYEELELAARVAYFETGSNDGYKAVLNVIYNRCLSSKFGGRKTSISTEVYRKSQFTVVTGSKFETTTAPDKIVEFADDIFNGGKTVLPEDVFFFRSAKSGTTWGDRVYYDTIGGNAFFYGG